MSNVYRAGDKVNIRLEGQVTLATVQEDLGDELVRVSYEREGEAFTTWAAPGAEWNDLMPLEPEWSI